MEVKLPNNRKRAILSKYNYFGKEIVIVMEEITKNEEENIFSNKIYKNKIPLDNIYFYGKIDIENETDIYYINQLDLQLQAKGLIIPTNYNFDTHSCESIDNLFTIGQTETFNILKIFKYNYALINKPERLIVYRDYITNLK